MARVRVDPKTQSRGVMIVNDQTTGRGEGRVKVVARAQRHLA